MVCTHQARGELWYIEAKGKTSAIGTDFRTCLGQLLLHMRDPTAIYAIALPDIREYRSRASQMSPWVIERLRLRWLFVNVDGKVEETQAAPLA